MPEQYLKNPSLLFNNVLSGFFGFVFVWYRDHTQLRKKILIKKCFNVYLCLKDTHTHTHRAREREREREREWMGEGQREIETESEAGSELQAVSTEPDGCGVEPMSREIMI